MFPSYKDTIGKKPVKSSFLASQIFVEYVSEFNFINSDFDESHFAPPRLKSE